jgi:hypothetical protein
MTAKLTRSRAVVEELFSRIIAAGKELCDDISVSESEEVRDRALNGLEQWDRSVRTLLEGTFTEPTPANDYPAEPDKQYLTGDRSYERDIGRIKVDFESRLTALKSIKATLGLYDAPLDTIPPGGEHPAPGDLAIERPGATPPEEPVQPEIFVSYRWGGDSEALVDEIQRRMADRAVLIIRDKSEARYRDSIRQFMQRIGAGKCVIVVLGKAYLESKSCMYELTQIASHPEFASRVYPIVMPDAEIYDAIARIRYVKYWENKRAELEAAIRQVGPAHLEGITDDLDLYDDIRRTIARIMYVLADMNTLRLEMHRGTDFEQLYTQLAAALQV